MERVSIEIKAKCEDLGKIEKILNTLEAEFLGIDHQIDTYFKVENGRMKLREGDIENYLIHYQRDNEEGPKKSTITIFKNTPQSSLKSLLEKSLGILTIVDKKRKIYFIKNIKFHLDSIENLGQFVEIEALDNQQQHTEEELKAQCEKYMAEFGINKKDLIANSYSDLTLGI